MCLSLILYTTNREAVVLVVEVVEARTARTQVPAVGVITVSAPSGTPEVGTRAYSVEAAFVVEASREGGKAVGICSVSPVHVTFSLHGVWRATHRLVEGVPFSCIGQMPSTGANPTNWICVRASFSISATFPIGTEGSDAIHCGRPSV